MFGVLAILSEILSLHSAWTGDMSKSVQYLTVTLLLVILMEVTGDR